MRCVIRVLTAWNKSFGGVAYRACAAGVQPSLISSPAIPPTCFGPNHVCLGLRLDPHPPPRFHARIVSLLAVTAAAAEIAAAVGMGQGEEAGGEVLGELVP